MQHVSTSTRVSGSFRRQSYMHTKIINTRYYWKLASDRTCRSNMLTPVMTIYIECKLSAIWNRNRNETACERNTATLRFWHWTELTQSIYREPNADLRLWMHVRQSLWALSPTDTSNPPATPAGLHIYNGLRLQKVSDCVASSSFFSFIYAKRQLRHIPRASFTCLRAWRGDTARQTLPKWVRTPGCMYWCIKWTP
jgi:hypothetical protein